MAFQVVSSHREMRDQDILILISIVACSFGISVHSLFAITRGKSNVALARQVTMYFLHVHFGKSFSEIGRLFGRDRTTVSYGCCLIEDKRENPTFDWTLDLIEHALTKKINHLKTLGELVVDEY